MIRSKREQRAKGDGFIFPFDKGAGLDRDGYHFLLAVERGS